MRWKEKLYVGDKEYDGSVLLAPESKTKPVLSEREGEEGASPSLGLVVCGLSHSVSPSQARTNQGDETSLDG